MRTATMAVRKHRAPKGALRPSEEEHHENRDDGSQKAPSTKRCIKGSSELSVGGGV